MITRDGRYAGTLTEGDILWELKHRGVFQAKELEEIPIRQVPRKRDNAPVNINCTMEELIMTAMNQNFIPVIDDNGIFIGIITRKSIIQYCYENSKLTHIDVERQ